MSFVHSRPNFYTILHPFLCSVFPGGEGGVQPEVFSAHSVQKVGAQRAARAFSKLLCCWGGTSAERNCPEKFSIPKRNIQKLGEKCPGQLA